MGFVGSEEGAIVGARVPSKTHVAESKLAQSGARFSNRTMDS